MCFYTEEAKDKLVNLQSLELEFRMPDNSINTVIHLLNPSGLRR